MKRFLLSLILLAAMPVLSRADEVTDLIKKEAEAYTKALTTDDLEAQVRYTHPRLVESSGGKDAMIAALKKAKQTSLLQGVTVEKVTVGAPEKPVKLENNWLVSLVPETLMAKISEGHATKEAHLIGISEDGGKKWSFVDMGPKNEAEILKMFPELKPIKMPERKKPVLTPAGK